MPDDTGRVSRQAIRSLSEMTLQKGREKDSAEEPLGSEIYLPSHQKEKAHWTESLKNWVCLCHDLGAYIHRFNIQEAPSSSFLVLGQEDLQRAGSVQAIRLFPSTWDIFI